MNRSGTRRRLLACCLAACLATGTYAQIADEQVAGRGRAFWCAFLENLDLSMNDAPSFAFQIGAERDVTGTVLLVGTGLSVPFSVAAGTVVKVDLPQAVYYPQGSEAVTNFGLLITASDTVGVTALHWRTFFSESAAILPADALGSHYLAQCYRYDGSDISAFTVVATEDNTFVTITPAATTLQGRPAGLAFSVQLNRGQTYQVQSLQDLAGTDIRGAGGKPLAVFGGAKSTNVECAAATSHLYDQCLPLDRGRFWSNRFFAVPFYGQANSVLRVFASEDDTQVMFGCDSVATLQRGQTWTRIYNTPDILYADKPVAVSQMGRGYACSGVWQNGDPMLLNLLPEGTYTRRALARVPKRTSTGLAFTSNTLTVIAKAGQSDGIRLNGVAIDNYVHTPLGPDWEFTRIFVQSDSSYLLDSDLADFQAYLHGFDVANAYSGWTAFDRVVLDTAAGGVTLSAPDTVCADSTFSIAVQGGNLQWLELLYNGDRQGLQPGASLQLGEPGTAVFSAAVQAPGDCQPRLVYARTVVVQCPPPPDTCALQIPNAFTPNGDQVNDLFGPLPAGCSFSEYSFRVYNRWGQRVFSTDEPFAGWDGRLPGGQDSPADAYAWMLTYRRHADAEPVRLSGGVTLLR